MADALWQHPKLEDFVVGMPPPRGESKRERCPDFVFPLGAMRPLGSAAPPERLDFSHARLEGGWAGVLACLTERAILAGSELGKEWHHLCSAALPRPSGSVLSPGIAGLLHGGSAP